jgi:Ca2+:H+ antiporter
MKLIDIVPLPTAATAALLYALPPQGWGPGLALIALLAAVLSSVHHAEVVAHRTGEPLGTLILALAVTVIETALILSVMLAGGPHTAALPRDTIYAAVMIICNGVIGLCLLLGAWHHREQQFRIEGMGAGFAALATLAVLVLIMPSLTTTVSGPVYSDSQLLFVALSSGALWLIFVFVQTVRHRDYFLPTVDADDETVHAPAPTRAKAWLSMFLLLLALGSVVALAKLLSPNIETAVKAFNAPQMMVGIVIAIIVLLPETWAALRAARADRLQTSMNLAIGSALASIGLTIPVVVLAAVLLGLPLELGLHPKDMALLALTFLVGSITLASGRTHLMHGAVHLVLFAAFLFLTLVP